MAIADGVQGAGGGAQGLQHDAPGRAGQPQIHGQNVRVEVPAEQPVPPVPTDLNADAGGREEDAKVEQALAPLREWRVTRARKERGVRDAALGSAIGAIVGTLILPGIGTGIGAGVGALVFGVRGAWIAHRKAREQAGAITPGAVAQDYGPGSKTFGERAREAGHDPGSFSPKATARMGATLSDILSGRARQGLPLRRELVKSAQAALIRLETAPNLSEQVRERAHHRLRAALADERDEINGAWVEGEVEHAVETLPLSEEANARMGATLSSIQAARTAQGLPVTREVVKSARTALIRLETAPDLSESVRNDAHDRLRQALGRWADEGYEIDGARVQRQVERTVGTLALARKAVCDALERKVDGREMSLDAADWERATKAMDAMALDRVFGGGAADGDKEFVDHAATALSDIAKSDLGDDLKNLVTDQLRASARDERVAPAALPAIAASLIETPPDP